jgi:hypothetical protein
MAKSLIESVGVTMFKRIEAASRECVTYVPSSEAMCKGNYIGEKGMPRKEQALDATGAIVIIKYDNRRLYDRGEARYITYRDVIQHVRAGQTVRVQSKRTGMDLTCETLLACLALMNEDRQILKSKVLHEMIRKAPIPGQKVVEDDEQEEAA